MRDEEAVIRVEALSRRFGRKNALEGVNLTIPRGSVYGLLGANGAGKTTLIRHILGLLKAEAGSVRVFGSDPVTDPVGVLGRIGYLAEENDLPDWMRLDELIRYTRAFYPTWDDTYAQELIDAFALPLGARLRHLSKGQRARAGLVAALAHRPELLVLDEPSSGLDPVVRRDILTAVVRTIADEGRTVLFSSHLLSEVERVADHVALIDGGRVVFAGELDEVKSAHRCVTVHLDAPSVSPPSLDGVVAWEGGGREWTAVCRTGAEERGTDVRIVEERYPSLDDLFVAYVGRKPERVGGPSA